MKICNNCGAENKNENVFCSTCGGNSFSEPLSPDMPSAAAQQPVPPPPPPPIQPIIPRKPFSIFDVMTILGFVSSLVGLFCIWVVLEPLAVISSILGFFKGSRYKGLAAAGFVIALIAFLIQLFTALYNGNIIGKWAIQGVFH